MTGGSGQSSQQTAKTVDVVENPIVTSASGTTRIARVLGLTKRRNMSMKLEPTEPYMPDYDGPGIDVPDPLSPGHYQWHPMAEAQQISGHFPHHLGAAIDYIWRVGRKGDPLEDIAKAIRHLEFERARLILLARASDGTATVPSYEQDDGNIKYG